MQPSRNGMQPSKVGGATRGHGARCARPLATPLNCGSLPRALRALATALSSGRGCRPSRPSFRASTGLCLVGRPLGHPRYARGALSSVFGFPATALCYALRVGLATLAPPCYRLVLRAPDGARYARPVATALSRPTHAIH